MFWDTVLKPILFRLDAERAHHLALRVLRDTPASRILGWVAKTVDRPVELWGLSFRNPLGLAAGFDKNAVALTAWHALGFGFVEIGTVTRHAQPGNEKPRLFRCPRERALVNRLGFPNEGAEVIAKRLREWKERASAPRFPVGVNIGKSKVTPLEEAEDDYAASFRECYGPADFFVVNVSSPNTPGLRELQRPEQLTPILRRLQEIDRELGEAKPLLLKIAPDLTHEQILEILAVASDTGIDGIVATNTTIDHSGVRLREAGGLSGAPLRARSTEVIRTIAKETGGRLPVIGVGGVMGPDDYREKIDAGASLVEVYTGFVYEGPRSVARILGT